MSSFQRIRDYAKGSGHHRMCAPIAMALTSGETFDDCHEMLTILGLRKGKRTGTTYEGHMKGLHELGFNTTRCLVPNHIKTNITLRGKLDPNKKYIIEYSGHVAAYVNGKIEDWSDGRRKRVIGIVEVTPTDGQVGEHQYSDELIGM